MPPLAFVAASQHHAVRLLRRGEEMRGAVRPSLLADVRGHVLARVQLGHLGTRVDGCEDVAGVRVWLRLNVAAHDVVEQRGLRELKQLHIVGLRVCVMRREARDLDAVRPDARAARLHHRRAIVCDLHNIDALEG